MPPLIVYAIFVLVSMMYMIRDLLRGIVGPFFSPLRQLPGPKCPSWATGHFLELFKPAKRSLYEQWEEEFGGLYVFKGLLSVSAVAPSIPQVLLILYVTQSNYLFLTDLKVINYVLQNPAIFEFPAYSRLVFKRILGEGRHPTDLLPRTWR